MGVLETNGTCFITSLGLVLYLGFHVSNLSIDIYSCRTLLVSSNGGAICDRPFVLDHDFRYESYGDLQGVAMLTC